MQKQKQKTIDKYTIGELLYEDSIGISIFKAKHSISEAHYIMKKALISAQVKNQSDNNNNHCFDPANLLYQEVHKIKQINHPRILKCLQRIKTKRSIYLIYENYPEYNLMTYIHKFDCPFSKRIKFGKIICETIQEIHRKSYIYLTLSPQSIMVDNKHQQLKFKGLEFAVNLGKMENSQVQIPDGFKSNQFIAPEIFQSGVASYESDIYSVGKIIQSLGLLQNLQSQQSTTKQIFDSMLSNDPSDRPSLNKIWSCLKMLENNQKQFSVSTRLKLTPTKSADPNFNEIKSIGKSDKAKSKFRLEIPKDKRLFGQDEKKIKKLLKIRNLTLYLHDLANFSLRQKDKQLFYLLLKKSVIIRANLLHQIKKMASLYSQIFIEKLKRITQTLEQQQTCSLNLLTKIQQCMNSSSNTFSPQLKSELFNRKQLNENYLEAKIKEFIAKKKKEIKYFHTAEDTEERMRLVYLCGMSEKLVYGSFEVFFDEVVNEQILEINEQKYFEYLRKGSTRQMLDRLDRIIKGKI